MPAPVRPAFVGVGVDLVVDHQRESVPILLGVDVRGVVGRHPADVAAGAGWVELPDALGRKYPGARVVVVELDDWDLDIALPEPIDPAMLAKAAQ